MGGSLAEREGFEPPIPFQVCPLSRRIVSTTHAPLRAVKIVVWRYFSRCCREEASGAKAPKALYALRGPKGPLFHGGANSTYRPRRRGRLRSTYDSWRRRGRLRSTYDSWRRRGRLRSTFDSWRRRRYSTESHHSCRRASMGSTFIAR